MSAAFFFFLLPRSHDVKRRTLNNVVLLFDGDSAGIKATIRSINLCLKAEMNVQIAVTISKKLIKFVVKRLMSLNCHRLTNNSTLIWRRKHGKNNPVFRTLEQPSNPFENIHSSSSFNSSGNSLFLIHILINSSSM